LTKLPPPADAKGAALTKHAVGFLYVGRYTEAVALFDAALELDDANVRALTGRALAAAKDGRPVEGLTSAEKALALDPANAVAYTARGSCLYHAGRFDEAQAAYERALGLGPENPAVLYNTACFWATVGDENKCREYLTRGFQYSELIGVEQAHEDPDLAPYSGREWFQGLLAAARTIDEASTAFHAGRYDIALEIFDLVLNAAPRPVRAYAGRSLSLAQLGRAQEGLTAADEAIRLNPSYARAHSARAFCLHRLRRHDEAAQAFEQAVRLAPGDHTILYNAACVWAERGDEAKCREYLEAALAQDDGSLVDRVAFDPDVARYADKEWFREALARHKRRRGV
jgi:tetratricopeptide (TPR) repeat protein